MNSFVGDRHPLADTEEFCGRLRAVKDIVPSQTLSWWHASRRSSLATDSTKHWSARMHTPTQVLTRY